MVADIPLVHARPLKESRICRNLLEDMPQAIAMLPPNFRKSLL